MRRLRALILSHPAADHDGGGAAVLRGLPTDLVLDGGAPGGGPTHAAAMAEARRRGVRVEPVRAGQRLRSADLDLDPLAHAAGRPPPRRSERPCGGGASSGGGAAALIPADAESNVLTRLPRLTGDVLVVSHHGSADPQLPAVLRHLRPRLAVISVGAGNDYGHPTPTTLAALQRARVPTLRTDRGGSVDLRVSDGQLRIRRSPGRSP